ncbi:MAG: ATP-dependent endonuclease [Methanothrix sp.]
MVTDNNSKIDIIKLYPIPTQDSEEPKFLFIPAVRDASTDAVEGKGSTITSLMDLVVRSVLAKKDAFKRLKEETQQKYEEIMDPLKLPELNSLASELTGTLSTFVPDARIELSWLTLDQVEIPMPKAEIRLVEDGYPSAVSRTGHGLQRAFILTMLQHLALAQAIDIPSDLKEEKELIEPEGRLPDLVLAIEEPELYQHPNRQRHFAKILMLLSRQKIPGVADKTQIIYGTHSPLFVGIDRIDQIRLLRKLVATDSKPKITKIFSTSLDKVSESVWEIEGKPTKGKYDGQTMLPRLQAIMTPWMNEGFFSDVAVLVEGEDDRAAILGIANANGYELEGNGFSIIPCGGKTNIGRPYLIFKKLNIPVYVIWDGDFGKGKSQGNCKECGRPLDKKPDPIENHKLLRLMGQKDEDWPEQISGTFACFKSDLETTLKEEIGPDIFDQCLKECMAEFCIVKQKHAIKNPNVIANLIIQAKEKKHTSHSLDEIVNKILLLKNQRIQ